MADHLPVPVRLWFRTRRARGGIATAGIVVLMFAFELELEGTWLYAAIVLGAALIAFSIVLSRKP